MIYRVIIVNRPGNMLYERGLGRMKKASGSKPHGTCHLCKIDFG